MTQYRSTQTPQTLRAALAGVSCVAVVLLTAWPAHLGAAPADAASAPIYTCVDSAGRRTPLTHGRIQLQSEGAETYFRDITLTPITRLPEIRAR